MDMPDLPEDRTPQDVVSGVSIDIQLPVGASDVSAPLPYSLFSFLSHLLHTSCFSSPSLPLSIFLLFPIPSPLPLTLSSSSPHPLLLFPSPSPLPLTLPSSPHPLLFPSPSPLPLTLPSSPHPLLFPSPSPPLPLTLTLSSSSPHPLLLSGCNMSSLLYRKGLEYHHYGKTKNNDRFTRT